MGVVDPPSDLMDLRSVNLESKNYRFRSYTPRDIRENGAAVIPYRPVALRLGSEI
jgi:hypothetical protein